MKSDVEKWLETEGEKFLREIGLKKGQKVLDFGCGEGHYTIPAAKIVGRQGKVYALDKEEEILSRLMGTAKSERLKNIEIEKTSGKLEIGLKDGSMDVVLSYDVLHYIDEKGRIFGEFARVLKPKGLLFVYPKHHKTDSYPLMDMGLEDIIREIKSKNFRFEDRLYKELIHDNKCEKDYILNFRKKA
jgi:ubiquinone/menaquinone biosynthesis C-methylase UbiE